MDASNEELLRAGGCLTPNCVQPAGHGGVHSEKKDEGQLCPFCGHVSCTEETGCQANWPATGYRPLGSRKRDRCPCRHEPGNYIKESLP